METGYVKHILKSSEVHLMLDVGSLASDDVLWRSAPFGPSYFAHTDTVNLDNNIK